MIKFRTRTFYVIVAAFALLSAVAVALFWVVWYLINGEVPVGNPIFGLSFSRWTDICVVPILAVGWHICYREVGGLRTQLLVSSLFVAALGIATGVSIVFEVWENTPDYGQIAKTIVLSAAGLGALGFWISVPMGRGLEGFVTKLIATVLAAAFLAAVMSFWVMIIGFFVGLSRFSPLVALIGTSFVMGVVSGSWTSEKWYRYSGEALAALAGLSIVLGALAPFVVFVSLIPFGFLGCVLWTGVTVLTKTLCAKGNGLD